MKLVGRIFVILCLVSSWNLSASVVRSQLTSAIEDREPTDDLGQSVSASADVTTLYFFTQIDGLEGKQIVHRWIYQGREMAAVTLRIGSNNWRTYSSKRLIPQWRGDWQVQVWLEDLQLMSHDFSYQ